MRTKMFLILMLIPVSAAFAGIDEGLTVSQADYSHDLNLTGTWFNNELSEVISFTGNSEINSVQKILPEMSFEAGVSGDYDTMINDLDDYNNQQMDLGSAVFSDLMPQHIPMLNVMEHVKLGVISEYDIGIKAGGLQAVSPASLFNAKNNILGLEFRKKITGNDESLISILGAVAANTVKGSIEIRSYPLSVSDTIQDPVSSTTTYNRDINSNTLMKNNWNFNSVSLRMIMSLRRFIIKPFVGLQADFSVGGVSSDYSSIGSITLTQADNSANTKTAAINYANTSSNDIPEVNIRALFGFDLNLTLLDLFATVEKSGENSATTVGVKIQF
jgi:hypothetical protein